MISIGGLSAIAAVQIVYDKAVQKMRVGVRGWGDGAAYALWRVASWIAIILPVVARASSGVSGT
ncbi:MAG: hypothetical protein ABI629_13075 [bacterium]